MDIFKYEQILPFFPDSGPLTSNVPKLVAGSDASEHKRPAQVFSKEISSNRNWESSKRNLKRVIDPRIESGKNMSWI